MVPVQPCEDTDLPERCCDCADGAAPAGRRLEAALALAELHVSAGAPAAALAVLESAPEGEPGEVGLPLTLRRAELWLRLRRPARSPARACAVHARHPLCSLLLTRCAAQRCGCAWLPGAPASPCSRLACCTCALYSLSRYYFV